MSWGCLWFTLTIKSSTYLYEIRLTNHKTIHQINDNLPIGTESRFVDTEQSKTENI